MSAVLPGRPQSRLQGLATGSWSARHITVYITGNAFTILGSARTILQTIYDEDETPLEAVAVDENTGKVATCTRSKIRIYRPAGLDYNALKVALVRFCGGWNSCADMYGSGLSNRPLTFHTPSPIRRAPCPGALRRSSL